MQNREHQTDFPMTVQYTHTPLNCAALGSTDLHVALWGPDCPGPPASDSWMLGLKTCAIMTWQHSILATEAVKSFEAGLKHASHTLHSLLLSLGPATINFGDIQAKLMTVGFDSVNSKISSYYTANAAKPSNTQWRNWQTTTRVVESSNRSQTCEVKISHPCCAPTELRTHRNCESYTNATLLSFGVAGEAEPWKAVLIQHLAWLPYFIFSSDTFHEYK